jgi:hypothetical protein
LQNKSAVFKTYCFIKFKEFTVVKIKWLVDEVFGLSLIKTPSCLTLSIPNAVCNDCIIAAGQQSPNRSAAWLCEPSTFYANTVFKLAEAVSGGEKY